LIAVLRDIRKLVGASNAITGISDKLADMASLDRVINHYATFVNTTPHLEFSIIYGKLTKFKTQAESAWREDHVTTGVFSRDELAAFKIEVMNLKKEKQQIKDDILAINITQTIELSTVMVSTLTTENLL
jgi:hypothetical protein